MNFSRRNTKSGGIFIGTGSFVCIAGCRVYYINSFGKEYKTTSDFISFFPIKYFAFCEVFFFLYKETPTMKILNKELLDSFAGKHADALSALQRRVNIVEDAE
jgi:hypothetical protein